MLTVSEAKAAGREDREDGLSNEELENIAESFIENFGGRTGQVLAAAYRKGAGL
jgi:hypothetical protein